MKVIENKYSILPRWGRIILKFTLSTSLVIPNQNKITLTKT